MEHLFEEHFLDYYCCFARLVKLLVDCSWTGLAVAELLGEIVDEGGYVEAAAVLDEVNWQ